MHTNVLILCPCFRAEWKKAYPAAVMIGVEGLPAKKRKEDWRFDGGRYISCIILRDASNV